MNNHHSEEGWRHVITNATTVRAIVGGQWTIILTGTTIAVALCAGNWGIVLKVRTYVRNKNNQCNFEHVYNITCTLQLYTKP